MPQRKKRQSLDRLKDEELLDRRICDLDVTLESTELEDRVEQLHDELRARNLPFRPHCWLSNEWFSPDGIPGIAIPFYLSHKRLMRLERKQMLEVEGGTREWCMKILRHEAGHAIDTAYRLRRTREFREVFGKASQSYPEFYQPRPYSKRFVLHLDAWYAQAHPLEDFAETFAVWLRPGARWKSRYKGWPALAKLEYMERTMQRLAHTKPKVVSRQRVDPVRRIKITLREHYQRKRDHYGIEHPNFYDRDLLRLFSDDSADRKQPTAAAFLSRYRRELRRAVAEGTGEYQYTIDQVLSEMIARCRELKLRLQASEADTKRDAAIMLAVQTMNYLHAGHHRLAM